MKMCRVALFLIPLLIAGCGGSSKPTTVEPPPPSAASLSNLTYDFGGNLVGTSQTQTVVTVTNTGSSGITLEPVITGDTGFTLSATGSCGATLAVAASCTEAVAFKPTVVSGASSTTAALNLGLGNVASGTPQMVTLTATSAALAAGAVTATNNPQVALYGITLPYPGSVTVNFGTDTTYGMSTWSQTTSSAGGTIQMLVAGMREKTTYHMQAQVTLDNGVTATDVDHTFTTTTNQLDQTALTTTTTPGMTPQPGIEELTPVTGPMVGILITDLSGNKLWGYPTPPGLEIDAVKLLSNGHFLITLGDGSTAPLYGVPPPANNVIALREIDLAGNIVRELSIADLNQEMINKGYNVTLEQFHHDVTPLPNGHTLVLSNTLKPYTGIAGFPSPVNVLGDVIVDLDENMQPDWVWNTFDHLDVNRHPINFPDWTHGNAVIYSPSDGNIIFSMRHQNWVIKIAFNDAAGNGDILWHLGYQGDFTLQGGSDPVDWQYAQHYPSLFGANSSGIFSLGVMDNGNDRVGCPSSGCPYSTIPVFQINETAKTATLTFHQKLPANLYSYFGGNTDLLANGNVEYDLAGTTNPTTGSDVYEVAQDSSMTTVWHMHSSGSNLYRAYRIPSLYPGVQW